MRKTIVWLTALAFAGFGGCDLLEIPEEPEREPEWMVVASVASDESLSAAYAVIAEGGLPVGDAVVQINGWRIPYTYRQYGAQIDPVAAGDTVHLRVNGAGASIDETLVMPAAPSGATAGVEGDNVTVSWGLPEQVDAVLVRVDGNNTRDGQSIEQVLDGGATQTTIATSLLESGGTVEIAIAGMRTLPLSGAAGSEFAVANICYVSGTVE
jgi:hypothetical protein